MCDESHVDGVRIREFRPEDLEAVFNLACRVFDEKYQPDVFLFFHSQWHAGQLVLESHLGAVAGFLSGTMGRDGRARIMLLALDPSLRGMGLGTVLLREFESRASAAGSQHVVLELRRSRERLLSFYLRHGFVVTGILPQYYSDGEDGVVMAKALQLNI